MPTLNWIGKQAVEKHHLEIPYRLLEYDDNLSVGDKESGNLIIQGDNLHALKALLPYYAGKVKCIYIDPPYNTGNEGWKYNDNVNAPEIKKWLNEVVGKEGEDLSRHDKWLCMMYPRLQLLKKLLRKDGVIFISIDDNEQANLRLLIDEIFGDLNFIALLPTIMNLKGNQDQFGFAGTHEYTYVYAKDKNYALSNNIKLIGEFNIEDEDYEIWEEDQIGLYKKGAPLRATGSESTREDRPYMFFPILVGKNDEVKTITDEEYRKIYIEDNNSFNDEFISLLEKKYTSLGYRFILPKDSEGNLSRWRWGWNSSTISKLKTEVVVVRNPKTKNITLYKKQRPELGQVPTRKPKSIFYKPEYSSGNGTAQLKSLFSIKVFNNPKPIELIKDFILLSTKKNDLILDSFAGSGTTGHAVLALNKEDGGNRKFILVELEEDIAKNVTAERIKRVINGYEVAKQNGTTEKVEGLGGGFRYCKLGEPLFDKFGNVRQGVKFRELAFHIFFSETGVPLKENTKFNSPFIGKYKGVAYYLLFNGILGDKSVNGGNVLTSKVLSELPPHNGQKIIFGESCRLSSARLKKENIIFKQIPYEIKTS